MSEEAIDMGVSEGGGKWEKEQVLGGVNGGGTARVINRLGHGEEIDPRLMPGRVKGSGH